MKRKVVPSGDGSQHEQRKVKPPAVEIFQALFQARNRKAASLDVTATPIARGHGEEAKENAPSGDAIVRLNVGGQVMMTYRSTLASAPAGSLLARMFGGEDGAGENGAWRPPRLADGSYFFDNNPEHFAIVLGVLRHGPCLLEDLSAHTRHGVHVLADYLGLVDIAEQCAPCGSTPVYNVAGGAHVPMADRRVIAVMGQGHMWRNGFEMGELGTCPRLVVCRTWHLAWIRDLVADMCHVPSEHAVVYACALRKNRTIRVDGLITPESSAPVFSICGRNFKHADAVVVVLDHALPVCLLSPADGGKTPEDDGDMPEAKDSKRALLFVRRYDHSANALSACTPVIVDTRCTLKAVLPILRSIVGCSPDARVHVIEEIHTRLFEKKQEENTLIEEDIGQGDIIWLAVFDDDADPPTDESLATLLEHLVSHNDFALPSHAMPD